jgi:cysteine desulfurase
MKKIYLDYAATTPVDGRVLRAMQLYFDKEFANTMSIHAMGEKTAEAVEKARVKVAKLIGAKKRRVFFTGSATESNNWAIKGIAWANQDKGKHLIISTIEHDCVLKSAEWLEKWGWEVSRLGVDEYGLVRLDELEKMIRKETVVVSVIHGNNEVGTIQELKKIGNICRKRGVYFHTDAAQSFGKERIDVEEMKIDLLTASSHKVYGPKGAALLYIREGVKIAPLLHGGGQENGMRSSTVNVPAIVGFGKAAEICAKEMKEENRRIRSLRDKLIKGILEIPGTRLNGHPTDRLANNANVSFRGAEGESLLLRLDMKGIEVSTGSACSSQSLEASHVLLAMGLSPEVAHGSIRFSLGRWTKEAEIDRLLRILPKIISDLRGMSPYKDYA